MKTLLWDVTDRCNLACIHCYNAGRYAHPPTIAEKYPLDVLFQKFTKMDIKHLHLLGGEPLCSPKFAEILEYADRNMISVTINTNGLLLENDTIQMLHHYGVKQVTISIDGASAADNDAVRGQGSFEGAMLGVRNLAQSNVNAANKIEISIASVINKINAKSIHQLASRIKQIGVDHWMVLAMYVEGNAARNYQLLSISPQQYYESLRRIAFAASVHNLHTFFDVKPRAYQSLCEEFGFDKSFIGNDTCRAGNQICFMNCQGQVFPCGPSSYSKGIVQGINVAELSQKKLEKLVHAVHTFEDTSSNQLQICEGCEHQSGCVRCPLKDSSFDAGVCASSLRKAICNCS